METNPSSPKKMMTAEGRKVGREERKEGREG
jgi:hypothetical protein